MARSVRAYIGLGANVGDARRTLEDAVTALAALPGARLRAVSRLYRTTPVGVTDQPDFVNAVVALDVPLGPDPATGATDLLVALKDLEREFGRRKRGRWGPRELDLDVLLFGRHRLAIERPPAGVPQSAVLDSGAAARLLEVPHPSMRDRLFVLAPLADLAPRLVPPGWRESVLTAAQRRRDVEGRSAAVPIGAWSAADRGWTGPTGGPIVVEPAVEADAEEAARVHTTSAEAAYRGYAPPEPDGLSRRTGIWREVLANPGARSFVARDTGRIVGVLNISRADDPDPEGEVRVLYVLPGWWGSPAGQLLLDRAHAELATSHDTARLTVLTANGRARRFYERNGWRAAETVVEPHFGGYPTKVTRYRRDLR